MDGLGCKDLAPHLKFQTEKTHTQLLKAVNSRDFAGCVAGIACLEMIIQLSSSGTGKKASYSAAKVAVSEDKVKPAQKIPTPKRSVPPLPSAPAKTASTLSASTPKVATLVYSKPSMPVPATPGSGGSKSSEEATDTAGKGEKEMKRKTKSTKKNSPQLKPTPIENPKQVCCMCYGAWDVQLGCTFYCKSCCQEMKSNKN
jgi:hypothetical protein